MVRTITGVALLVSSAWVVSAQQQKGATFVGERILMIVPLVGAGTAADPVRPLLVPNVQVSRERRPPAPDQKVEPVDSGILSWRFEASSDGKTALVEVVAKDQETLKQFRTTGRADVKVFDAGRATKQEIETEFRKYKPDFDAEKFGTRPAMGARGAQEVRP